MHVLRGLAGLLVLLLICFLLSNNRRAVNWKLVAAGLLLQFGLAWLILSPAMLGLSFNPVHIFFQSVADCFVKVIAIFHKGTEFVFGKAFSDPSGPWGFVFAVQVLPTIVIFSALSALLYYLGVLQKICFVFAWILSRSMKLSGSESMSTAANIFLGQTEAPLMIKPYLASMSRSELLLIMIGGMANTAGSVLAAYVQMLGGNDGELQAFYALHLLTQSIISAPAAVVVSKMMYPQTMDVERNLDVAKENIGGNMLDAISNGTYDGLRLAVNVAAMLIVFTALVWLVDATLLKIGSWTNINDHIAAFSGGRYSGFSLRFVFGYLFAPLAWVIGVPAADMLPVGQLLGEKTMINEFFAYTTLASMKDSGMLAPLSPSMIIVTYALSGFANFASIGIQIGGIGVLAPSQRKALSELGIRALAGGTIACLMTAVVAGIMFRA